MALRDQPYLPLYVQDYLTDEKLSMCTWSTQGVYIKILCLLHKSDPYGTILLKQNDKQTQNVALNFAMKIMKLLPIEKDTIYEAINQLIDEGCLSIDGDKMFQKRMVRDNELSIVRAESGRAGGLKTQFAKAKAEARAKANIRANTENENENENEIEKEGKGGKRFKKPTVDEIKEYCEERKNGINAQSFFDHYEARGWIPKGYTMQMKDWKAAVRTWEKNNSNYKNNGSNQQNDKRSDKRVNDYWSAEN